MLLPVEQTLQEICKLLNKNFNTELTFNIVESLGKTHAIDFHSPNVCGSDFRLFWGNEAFSTEPRDMKECKWPEYWDEACNADKTPIAEYKVKLRLAYALYYEY